MQKHTSELYLSKHISLHIDWSLDTFIYSCLLVYILRTNFKELWKSFLKNEREMCKDVHQNSFFKTCVFISIYFCTLYLSRYLYAHLTYRLFKWILKHKKELCRVCVRCLQISTLVYVYISIFLYTLILISICLCTLRAQAFFLTLFKYSREVYVVCVKCSRCTWDAHEHLLLYVRCSRTSTLVRTFPHISVTRNLHSVLSRRLRLFILTI